MELHARYLRKDEWGGIIETPEELFHRVARAVTAAERNYGASDAKVELAMAIVYPFKSVFVEGS